MVHEKDPCPICHNQPNKVLHTDIPGLNFTDCPRCGYFFIYLTAVPWASNYSCGKRQRAIASSTIRNMQHYTITMENYEELFARPDKSVLEKIDNLLLFLERSTETLASQLMFSASDLALQAECWALDAKEIHAMLLFLKKQDKIEWVPPVSIGNATDTPNTHRASITYKGWEYIENLRMAKTVSNQGFVAMWFNEEVNNIFDNVLRPAIEGAGYSAMRIDKKNTLTALTMKLYGRFGEAALSSQTQPAIEAAFTTRQDLPTVWGCRFSGRAVKMKTCILMCANTIASFGSPTILQRSEKPWQFE